MLRRFAHGTKVGLSVADINAAVRSSVDVTKPRYRRFAEVELNLSQLPPMVCNVGALNQAFVQILESTGDTLEATRTQSGEPSQIVVETKKLEGGWISVEFKDNGSGIPTQEAEATGKPRFSGQLGNRDDGLADTCRIVEEHGGVLEMNSVEGSGSRFTVKLPIR